MNILEPTRRGFLTAMLAAAAAPMIVKASSLMKIVPLEEPFEWSGFYSTIPMGTFATITRKALIPRLILQLYDQTPMMQALLKAA